MPTDCEWPIDPGCSPEEWAGYPPEVQARSSGLATATLRRLSGYRVGGCPITVRPCVKSCWQDLTYVWARWGNFGPHQTADGSWVNSCGCNTDCSCEQLCEVVLAAPVGPVSSVKVDGVDVPTTDYRIDGNRLVWIGDYDCPWPVCQDMTAADTEVGTFSVTYLNAHAPDTLAAYAAGVLAVEFAKACTGSKCRLPSTVTAVTRQGVSFDLAAGSFAGGMTGIREVDAWISLWRPEGSPTRAATVWYPGIRTPRVVG